MVKRSLRAIACVTLPGVTSVSVKKFEVRALEENNFSKSGKLLDGRSISDVTGEELFQRRHLLLPPDYHNYFEPQKFSANIAGQRKWRRQWRLAENERLQGELELLRIVNPYAWEKRVDWAKGSRGHTLYLGAIGKSEGNQRAVELALKETMKSNAEDVADAFLLAISGCTRILDADCLHVLSAEIRKEKLTLGQMERMHAKIEKIVDREHKNTIMTSQKSPTMEALLSLLQSFGATLEELKEDEFRRSGVLGDGSTIFEKHPLEIYQARASLLPKRFRDYFMKFPPSDVAANEWHEHRRLAQTNGFAGEMEILKIVNPYLWRTEVGKRLEDTGILSRDIYMAVTRPGSREDRMKEISKLLALGLQNVHANLPFSKKGEIDSQAFQPVVSEMIKAMEAAVALMEWNADSVKVLLKSLLDFVKAHTALTTDIYGRLLLEDSKELAVFLSDMKKKINSMDTALDSMSLYQQSSIHSLEAASRSLAIYKNELRVLKDALKTRPDYDPSEGGDSDSEFSEAEDDLSEEIPWTRKSTCSSAKRACDSSEREERFSFLKPVFQIKKLSRVSGVCPKASPEFTNA